MTAVINWLQELVSAIPLPVLAAWGRSSYVIGLGLAVCAFGGFTFRLGDGWGPGRERQAWDEKAFLCIPLTFILLVSSGYLGSFVVLVSGAQTFESLKDLVVLLCIVLFGYPALIITPFAYGVSDLIEGVPPGFILGWLPGYFINPACFWLAYQLFGKAPDFRRAKTWVRYLIFVLAFLAIEPVLWGFICSDRFTPEISYRVITPALLFTTTITWIIGPFAMLGALPLARRFGLFWADIPGHVREERLGGTVMWEAGSGPADQAPPAPAQGLPLRMSILAPFMVLLLLTIGTTAYVALKSAEDDANRLAARLHGEISVNLTLRLDAYLSGAPWSGRGVETAAIVDLLQRLPIAREGRAFIIDRSGVIEASSVRSDDAVVNAAVEGLRRAAGGIATLDSVMQFRFDHLTRSPSRETWLAQATPYREAAGDWIVITAMPEAFYLAGVRRGSRRSAMVFAVALVLCLAMAAVSASAVTAPLRRISGATRALAGGDLTRRVPGSHLTELNVLAESFNDMAEQLKATLDRALREVEVRKKREMELEASEARARGSEARLQMAIRASGIGFWHWDVGKDQLNWDESMYRLYGLSRDDAAGPLDDWWRCLIDGGPSAGAGGQSAAAGGTSHWTRETFLEHVVPEDRGWLLERVQQTLSAREDNWNFECRVRRRDGQVRWIMVTGHSGRDQAGTIVLLTGVVQDVTERKRIEEEMRHLNTALEERVRQRTSDLEAANRELEAFSYSVSHDLHAPLRAIDGFANLALKNDGPQLPADGRRRLQIIRESAQRMGMLINDLLRFSRLGRQPLTKSAVDMGRLARESYEDVRSAQPDRHVAFQIADLPMCEGDPSLLKQVWINLLSNAIKYTRGCASPAIEVGCRREGGCDVYFVRDNGAGFDMRYANKLFAVFQRLHRAEEFEGTGAGLAIVHRIIQRHGGRIWAEARVGEGATFFFTLDGERTE